MVCDARLSWSLTTRHSRITIEQKSEGIEEKLQLARSKKPWQETGEAGMHVAVAWWHMAGRWAAAWRGVARASNSKSRNVRLVQESDHST